MSTLTEILTQPEVRPQVVQTCASLVDQEVESKRGVTGFAIKAGYRVINKLRPTMVNDVIDRLLPEFAGALEPMYQESTQLASQTHTSSGVVFASHLQNHAAQAADALLSVTDKRAEKASGPLKKTYEKLRGIAHEQVQQAVPHLADRLTPFINNE